MHFLEHHKRSWAKALTYRVLIIVSNGVIIYLLTGNYLATMNVLVVTTLVSTLLYVAHERAWNHIHWGKSHTPEKT